MFCLLTTVSVPAPPAAGAPLPAPSGTTEDFVKYVPVRTDAGGRVEYLWEVALRVLGDERRYLEIFALNRDRVQPDGARLTDPAALHPGWTMVLPWDAVGEDVRYGPPPAQPPAPPSPAGRPVLPPAPPATGTVSCGAAPGRLSAGVPWAQLRLGAEAAWTRSRGRDVTVAVIDSGVDASAPTLAGRVGPGADAGTRGRGDADCLGHGTAVAGILAAAERDGSAFVGVAPEASIVPIRVRHADGIADPGQVATALDLAVAAGAGVAMLGATVDVTDSGVSAALTAAVAADVVVVLAAPPQSAAAGTIPDGVLRVGAIGPDDRLTEAYAAGAVDVVAPGAGVTGLGLGGGEIEGSGTGFAVPFVAGTVALLRAAEPSLPAAAVAERIRTTAERETTTPDAWYGWGVINPAAAVNATPPRPPSTFTAATPTGLLAVLVTVLAFGGMALGMRRRRRR
ncbi:S8 family serine peptidase [Catenuloplanes japonicus]|uniref:S8 family serine peptidase n=1 Tax=Catenuloplanes japonicus TaxID=33876 RepID=UPI0018DD8532|nr:S8 family serine peptidase [Catenuloplanes japonicus]